ncbi:hypothetical protein FHG87_003462, partial [Trinorchestia longiramus]
MAVDKDSASYDLIRNYHMAGPPQRERPKTAVAGPSGHSLGPRPSSAEALSPELWRLQYRDKIGSAKSIVSSSKSLGLENQRASEATVQRTKSLKKFVDTQLEKRRSQVQYWRSEVDLRQDLLTSDTDNLKTMCSRLEKQHALYLHPLQVALHCLELRSERGSWELVEDLVQAALKKEVLDLKRCRSALDSALIDVRHQVRLDKAVIYHLKKDLAKKNLALDLDGEVLDLLPAHNKTNILPVEVIAASAVSVEEWEQQCTALVERCDQQHLRSNKVSVN